MMRWACCMSQIKINKVMRSTEWYYLPLTCAAIACSCTGKLADAKVPSTPSVKPNVIFILADDLGYADLNCYNKNSGINTPNIDRLASEGIRFTHFYATSNISSPSRRALLTGRYQSRLGEWAEAYPGTPSRDAVDRINEPCFTQYIKKAGYRTGCFGKWNIGEVNGVSTPDAQGFDYWIGSFHNHSYFGHKRNNGILDFWENGQPAPQYEGQWSDDVFIGKAMDFIRENAKKPFFVYLPLCTPHTPFQDPENPDESGFTWWNEKGGTLGQSSPKLSERPLLKKMVEHMDTRIGQLLDLLVELNIDKNTIVIFASDNGGTQASLNTPLRGYKQGMLEGGIRIPAVIKWPGVYPAGEVTDQVGIMFDFSRTLVNACGAEKYVRKDHDMDGIDLTPILTGKQEAQARELGWRRRDWNAKTLNNVWAEAYFKGDWKYIREFKETPGYARSILKGQVYPKTGYIELLFNLKNDIGETTDLSQSHPDELIQMREAFERWKAEVVNRTPVYVIPSPDQYVRDNL